MFLFNIRKSLRILCFSIITILSFSISKAQSNDLIHGVVPSSLKSFYIKEKDSSAKKLVLVYLDLDNCYNCNQGLRVLSGLNPEYKFFYYIKGLNARKLNAFKAEYKIKHNIHLIQEGSDLSKFLMLENRKFYLSASTAVFVENPYFYTSVCLSNIQSLVNKRLKPFKSLQIKDSSYFTSINDLVVYNHQCYFTLAPKNILMKMSLSNENKLSRINLDAFYFDSILMEGFYSSIGKELRAINDTFEIAEIYKSYIQDKGYNKSSIINFRVLKDQLLIFCINYYPVWKDSTKSKISLKPYSYIIRLNKNDQFSVFRPLNINNLSTDTFYYDYSNVLELQPNGDLLISVIPNQKYLTPKKYPLDARMVYSFTEKRYVFSKFENACLITPWSADTTVKNAYLLSHVMDENKTLIFKSINYFKSAEDSILRSFGFVNEIFKDSITSKYFVSKISNINDSVVNVFTILDKVPMVLKLNIKSGALLDYSIPAINDKLDVLQFNSVYLSEDQLYVVSYNNSLESDEFPIIYQFKIQ